MLPISRRLCLTAVAVLATIPLAAAFVPAPATHATAPLPHPHFPKTLVCSIPKGPTITVKYQTVTFDREGAAKMAVGKAWHLAGATFETSSDLVVGGHKVKAGNYALSAQKTDDGFVLTLHEGRGFSRPGDDAIVLKTEFSDKSELFEHLNCDIQPGGDKQHTHLYLDVRFDRMRARALIELPSE